LICDLLRCDIRYTASRMESYSKITFIVVGPDPENTPHLFEVCGPGSVVGVATGYGLDGPGIESR
jgi:hypothetical protein